MAAVAGLAVGAAVGGLYAWFQVRSLRQLEQARRRGEQPPLGAQLPAAMARLVFLVVVLGLVMLAPPERINKWWLTGSLLVFYSVPLCWRLKQLFGEKR